MQVQLGLGAELDIASGQEVKDMGDGLLSAFRDSTKSRVPIRTQRTAVGVGDGTNVVALRLGAPPVGSEWKLLSISTFGSDDNTIVGSLRAALYIGSAPGSASLANLVVPGLVLPTYVGLGSDEIYATAQDLVFVLVQAPALGQQVGVNVRFEEWRIAERSRLNGA